MQSPSKTHEISVCIGITEGLGAYELTKVVTIYPRFILANKSKETIWIREPTAKEPLKLEAGEKMPISWLRDAADPRICVALDAPFDKQWRVLACPARSRVWC